jgi:hypothetical protein
MADALPARRERRTGAAGPPPAEFAAVTKRTMAGLVLGFAGVGCASARDTMPGCDFNRPAAVALMASHPLARLVRTICYGRCPEYAVEIDIDGEVTYRGGNYVMTAGLATSRLSVDDLRSLRQAVVRARQAELPRDQCACGCVTDSPYVELTTWDKGLERTYSYDQGCERAPSAMRALELEVDRVVGIERWIGTEAAREACFVEERDCRSLKGVPEPTP